MKPLDALCAKYKEYLDALPTWERSTRISADIGWCLAYTCPDFTTLPSYWRYVVGTLLYGLRFREHGLCKSRSAELDTFCDEFKRWLWDKHTRHTIAMCSSAPWYLSRVVFQQDYDQMLEMWGELNA